MRAVVMAGGRSERMRAGGGGPHKALVPVAGVPLLERNVVALLAAGFGDVVVVVRAGEAEVEAYARTRCRALVESWGTRFTCMVETEPLGTIGAARTLAGSDGLLVVNVDNLTALDLAAFAAHHRASGAAMTVAVHWEPFRLPYGEVRVDDGWITAVAEKPVKRFLSSSGTYVLSAAACDAIPAGRATGAPELMEILRARRDGVAAFHHESAWTDVNDAHSLARAERMVAGAPAAFELWPGRPDREVTRLLVAAPNAVWLRPRASTEGDGPGGWALPTLDSPPAADPVAPHARAHLPALGAIPTVSLASFDEADPARRVRVRCHVAAAAVPRPFPVPYGAWVPLGGDGTVAGAAREVDRALAALRLRGAAGAEPALAASAERGG